MNDKIINQRNLEGRKKRLLGIVGLHLAIFHNGYLYKNGIRHPFFVRTLCFVLWCSYFTNADICNTVATIFEDYAIEYGVRK